MSAAIAISTTTDRPKMSGLQNRVVAICILVGLIDGFNYFVLSYVLPSLSADFGQGPGKFAFAFTAGSIGTMLSASSIAPMADRFGRTKIIALGVALFSISTMGGVFATTISMICLSRFVAGIGAGCVASPVYALATEYSIGRLKNTSATMVASGTSLGGALCGVAAAYLLSHGWRTMFFLAGAIPLVLFLVCWRWLPESIGILVKQGKTEQARAILRQINPSAQLPEDLTAEVEQRTAEGRGFAALFSKGRAATTLLVWGAMFFAACAAYVLFSYLATFLVRGGVSEPVALLATSLATFGGLIGGNLIAMVVDRTRLKLLGAALGPLVTVVSTALLSYSLRNGAPGDLMVLALMFGIGFGLLGTAATVVAIAANCFPVDMRSTAMGTAITVANFGGLVSPLLGGALLETNVSTPTVVMMTTVPSIITGVFILLIARYATYGTDG